MLIFDKKLIKMTKHFTILLLSLGVTLSSISQVQTPQPSPSSKFEQTIGLTNVSIDYSRPGMRGRTIFGDLVPYGKLWRTGANLRTKITFSDDVTISGKELKAGTYAILTVPNEEQWEIIFYTEHQGGGAPAELDDSKVALSITEKTKELGENIESFSIGIESLTSNSGELYFVWEKTKVEFKIETPSATKAEESIKAALAGPSANDYFQSAAYYFAEDKDINQAKEWIDKVVEMQSEPGFWQVRLQSLIYAKLGDTKGAIAAATYSLELSEKAGNADYVKMNKESIAEWSK